MSKQGMVRWPIATFILVSLTVGTFGLRADTCRKAKTPKVKWVNGIVVGASGQPVLGATITLQKLDGQIVAEGKVDIQGRFAFPPVSYGKYMLNVSAEGFRTYNFEIGVSRWRSERTGVVVTLGPGSGCSPSTRTTSMPDSG